MNQREVPLSQPDIRMLLQRLPLPIALLKRDGAILGTSVPFDQTYGEHALRCLPLHALPQDRSPRWESIEVTLRDGRPHTLNAYLTSFRDDVLVLFAEAGCAIEDTGKVAELESRVAELERLVATDRLTGAWNRAHLDRIMAMEMSRSMRYRQPLSVVLLDIDLFGKVSDTCGYAAGDAVLRQLVQVVQDQLRPGDMLFRRDGEQFLVLLPSTPYHRAHVVAEKMRSGVERAGLGAAGDVTISLGIAERDAGESADALFERARKALSAAKSCGGNRALVDEGGCSDRWRSGVLRLEWSDEYASGNAVIDAEHRGLFALANRLIEASLQRSASQSEIKEALVALLREVQRHFADEESILERMSYIRVAQHKQAHAALLKRATQMRVLADNGMLTFGTLVDFLANDVVAGHLIATDRQFFPLFKPENDA